MKTKSDIWIKVLSLGVGLAVGIVLIAKVFFELSYDSFYKDIDRVYTINTWYSHQGEEKDYGQVSGAVAVGFMDEVPGVEAGTRTTYVFNGNTYLDENGNKLSGTLVCADTCFFQVFDRPILAGDPVKVLGKWGSVMVSRSFAEKLADSSVASLPQNDNRGSQNDTGGSQNDTGGSQNDNPVTLNEVKGLMSEAKDLSGVLGNLTGVDPRPSALFYGEIGSMSSWMPHIFFKLDSSTSLGMTKEKVRQALEQALEGREINILSYEEQMRAAYADSKKMRNTMAIGAVFSLLIALLGLIGFIRDESLRRSKEMAVRKINGATTRDILSVFAVDILKLSGVMAVLACIGAFFVARKWLERFAEKVSLNPLYFIGGALLVLLIVLGVVVLNCLKIARANPVESLKNE